jgi:hypothetical protein
MADIIASQRAACERAEQLARDEEYRKETEAERVRRAAIEKKQAKRDAAKKKSGGCGGSGSGACSCGSSLSKRASDRKFFARTTAPMAIPGHPTVAQQLEISRRRNAEQSASRQRSTPPMRGAVALPESETISSAAGDGSTPAADVAPLPEDYRWSRNARGSDDCKYQQHQQQRSANQPSAPKNGGAGKSGSCAIL